MIVVHSSDDGHEFADATRVSTDEHNNLEIWAGKQGDLLLALFHRDQWIRVEIDHGRPA